MGDFYPDKPLMQTCANCGVQFQFGPHRYDGTCLGEIDVMVCDLCGPEDRSDRARREAIDRIGRRLGLTKPRAKTEI
ncbi:hypothetical protein C3941_11120 [Kaistia algarum]|nr:hypothetical protein C3941_11120 [Kaistia algarum]